MQHFPLALYVHDGGSELTVSVFRHVNKSLGVCHLTAILAAVFGRHHWVLALHLTRPLNCLHGARVFHPLVHLHGGLAVVQIRRQRNPRHLLRRRDHIVTIPARVKIEVLGKAATMACKRTRQPT